MGFRVEVGFNRSEDDARGRTLADQINQDLQVSLGVVRVYDVYYIDLDDVAPTDAEVIGSDLLADPVLESFWIDGQMAFGFDWAVEVSFLPGVTDNVGRTAAEAIAEILSLSAAPTFVRTARLYTFEGDLAAADIDRICLGILANPLVNEFRVLSEQDYRRHGYYPPRPLSKHQPQTKTVSLPDDDEGLERLSREGLLALTVAEMRAIKDYFSEPEVVRERRQAGLPADPTDVELETLAQTWSEHCKHKIFNSRINYRHDGASTDIAAGLFKTYIRQVTEEISKEKDWLVSVFTDNAGVISLNESHSLVFKVETHNHPSALDPYGGALTGIVGVNRDPMGTGLGAELIFNTDVFCFGPPDLEAGKLPPGILHPRRIFRGVRKGVEDGGNKIGIPTVNGAILFDEAYTFNPLVFCGTGGIIPKEILGRPAHEKKIEPGDLIVMCGGRIGKDGIHGATFSSIKLDEETPPAVVQIGAPIVQKKLMDVLIEARDRGLYRAITDNGAGGLSSSVGEMAELSGGAVVDLDRAPLKYPGLDPWEIWVSESQERMTLAVDPEAIDELLALFKLRDVEAAVIGRFSADGRLLIRFDGKPVGRLDLDFLHGGLPPLQLEALWEPPPAPTGPIFTVEPTLALKAILSSLNVCSKESVIRQYDHEVQGTSVVKPLVGEGSDGPSDAAVLRPRPEEKEGVVVACGINPRYGKIDPYHMAVSAVDEAVRNAVAVGADPDRIAVLDNFCWGNPIKSPANPDGDIKLGQLVRAAQGCYDAAKALGTPFISGKDSFHNEYDLGDQTVAIPPTLLISSIGVIADTELAVTMDVKEAGDAVYVLGLTVSELGGSHYAMLTGGWGRAPGLNPGTLRVYRALHRAITKGLVSSCHDCSEGGIAVALAESAFAGGLGISVNIRKVPSESGLSDVERLFSETNGRFVVTVKPAQTSRFEAAMAETHWARIGEVTAEGRLVCVGVDDRVVIESSLAELKEAWQEPLQWV